MEFLPRHRRAGSLVQRTTRVACLALLVATLTGPAATSAIAATTGSDGPTATISPIPAGNGTGVAPAGRRADDLTPGGYAETELLVSGVAHVYSGPATGPASATTQAVPYTTRLIVRAPSSPKDFSGRVMVEPMNTSGGGDSDAGWGFIGSRLIENGDAWVGVTVRYSSDALLKKGDPVRYAAINVPTSSVAWDVLAQVGQLVRTGGTSGPLGALEAEARVHGGLLAERDRRGHVRGRDQSPRDAGQRQARLRRVPRDGARREPDAARPGNGVTPRLRVQGRRQGVVADHRHREPGRGRRLHDAGLFEPERGVGASCRQRRAEGPLPPVRDHGRLARPQGLGLRPPRWHDVPDASTSNALPSSTSTRGPRRARRRRRRPASRRRPSVRSPPSRWTSTATRSGASDRRTSTSRSRPTGPTTPQVRCARSPGTRRRCRRADLQAQYKSVGRLHEAVHEEPRPGDRGRRAA